MNFEPGGDLALFLSAVERTTARHAAVWAPAETRYQFSRELAEFVC